MDGDRRKEDRRGPDRRKTERRRLSPMKRLDLWRWRYFDSVAFKWVETDVAMTEADAKLQLPEGTEKVLSTREERWVPDGETDASPSSEDDRQ
jgi:hypothetical protein